MRVTCNYCSEPISALSDVSRQCHVRTLLHDRSMSHSVNIHALLSLTRRQKPKQESASIAAGKRNRREALDDIDREHYLDTIGG